MRFLVSCVERDVQSDAKLRFCPRSPVRVVLIFLYDVCIVSIDGWMDVKLCCIILF